MTVLFTIGWLYLHSRIAADLDKAYLFNGITVPATLTNRQSSLVVSPYKGLFESKTKQHPPTPPLPIDIPDTAMFPTKESGQV